MKNKEKIIVAALKLFAENGYSKTSISSIAQQANVSKGLTYTHFKNKEELLEVTIERTITKMTSEMMDIKELNFNSFFEGYFDSLKKNTEIIRLCLLLVIHPQTPEKVISLLDKQKSELLELLSGLLIPQFKEDAPKEAEILLATIDGITIEFSTNPDSEYLMKMQHYLTKKYI